MQTFGNRLRAVTALKSALLLLFISGCCVNLGAASNRQSAAANTFLVVSDFHFNPMADPALVSQLDKAAPTEWEAILNRSKPAAFSQYGQDTNWWLLQSSLDQMHNTIPHPAFILIAGDSLAHRFPQQFQSATHDSDRDHYREFVLKTVKFLVLELRKRYPTEKIFVTPGNNDENCGNYSIRAGGAFLHDTAGIVRELAHGDDRQSSGSALTGAIWDSISKYIRDYLEDPITVETLAGIAQMPPERFGAAFRQATGMSVRQWEMDHRVRSAQRLLADNPNESLTEIATLCGFADQSHFSRAFLKVVGLTPTAWLHSRT